MAQLFGRRRAAEADKATMICGDVFKIIRTSLLKLGPEKGVKLYGESKSPEKA